MIYDWPPKAFAFAGEKHRGCCTDTHFSKALPSTLTQVAEFHSGQKLKVKGANFALFVREKVKMSVQICPETPVHDDKGKFWGCARLVASTSEHHFLPTSTSSRGPGWSGDPPLPPRRQAGTACCVMLRRHDCFVPSQWWLHINCGLMSPLSIT